MWYCYRVVCRICCYLSPRASALADMWCVLPSSSSRGPGMKGFPTSKQSSCNKYFIFILCFHKNASLLISVAMFVDGGLALLRILFPPGCFAPVLPISNIRAFLLLFS